MSDLSADLSGRRRRLEILRDRFIAVSMRSRTLRLGATSRQAAFDLSRVARQQPRHWAALVARLGDEEFDAVTLCHVTGETVEELSMSGDLDVLHSNAREERMASGADTLAVGWPFVQGVARDGTWFRAPLFIFPVELSQNKVGRLSWEIKGLGAPVLNDALVQCVTRLFGVRWSMEAFLERDADGAIRPDAATWAAILETLEAQGLPLGEEQLRGEYALYAFERWRAEERALTPNYSMTLTPHAILGRFPVAATSVILDYQALLEQEPTDEVLGAAASLLGVDESVEAQAWREHEVREEVSHRVTSDWRPLLSDSSQDAVVEHLSQSPRYRGVVVQGPPGTGKSQLIANLLCEVMARGETALLVCQKRAALDVVAARLGALGLGEALGLVHDVRRDRNDFCQQLASTLGPLLDVDQAQQRQDQLRQDGALRLHAEASREVTRRLELAEEAWRAQTGAAVPRPGLAELDERASEDPGVELPDLIDFHEEISRDGLEEALLWVARDVARAAPFVAPHPWVMRGELSGKSAADVEALTEGMRRLQEALEGAVWRAEHGTMPLERARQEQRRWEAFGTLIEALSGGDEELDDFALFWTWCDGEAQAGTWRAVTDRLERARAALGAVPWSLVVRPRRELEAWITELDELSRLEGMWWRFFSLKFWRLKKIPQAVLEVVAQTPSYAEAMGEGVPVALSRLCAQAIGWQELIAALPEDNAFFDFGFQGDPEQIDEAIEAVRHHVELVGLVHRASRELRQFSSVYEALPEMWSVVSAQQTRALPFFAALRADADAERCWQEVVSCAAQVAWAFPESWRHDGEAEIARGEGAVWLAQVRALCAHLTDLPELFRFDDEVRERAPFLKHFLRWHRDSGALPATEALRWAVWRAWRAGWRADEARAARWQVASSESSWRAALEEAVDRRRESAAQALVSRYRRDLRELGAQGEGRRGLAKLLSQARKQRFRLTLRQLVDQFWSGGLRQARPLWLCSPDSVASLFPLDTGFFDVVIFDEASQCPVESATGVMVRGGRVVIAGDDQQMPPSHFFASSAVDVDEEALEEESLLASDSLVEAARNAFDHVTLRWHYRSRHEALIAFSNMAFYGNKLKTAPGLLSSQTARDPRARSGVSVERVEGGIWSEQRNDAEALVVVEQLAELLAEEEPPTIGVVTFNLKQAECIERLIAARAATDAHFASHLERDRGREAMDQLFVRNLENVQGDERDVIIMSVGYAPSAPGEKVRARFGPLGQEGGHRRLNVAITRARQAYRVVLSFDPEELEVSQSKHLGPKLFKHFLCYANALTHGAQERAEAELTEAARLVGSAGVVANRRVAARHGEVGAQVREELARELEARGHQVERHVGMGDLVMDLAVTLAGSRGQVGVDITGYLSTPDAMTREVYVPRFWARAGWEVVRVTAGEWREDAARVVARIEGADLS